MRVPVKCEKKECIWNYLPVLQQAVLPEDDDRCHKKKNFKETTYKPGQM